MSGLGGSLLVINLLLGLLPIGKWILHRGNGQHEGDHSVCIYIYPLMPMHVYVCARVLGLYIYVCIDTCVYIYGAENMTLEFLVTDVPKGHVLGDGFQSGEPNADNSIGVLDYTFTPLHS